MKITSYKCREKIVTQNKRVIIKNILSNLVSVFFVWSSEQTFGLDVNLKWPHRTQDIVLSVDVALTFDSSGQPWPYRCWGSTRKERRPGQWLQQHHSWIFASPFVHITSYFKKPHQKCVLFRTIWVTPTDWGQGSFVVDQPQVQAHRLCSKSCWYTANYMLISMYCILHT